MALNSLGLGFVFTARDLASAKMTSLERRFSSLDDRVSGGTERITGAFRELGIGLAVFTAGAATVAGAFALADAAGRFEQAIAAVAAVSGATATELEALRNAAIDAGIETQFSPTEATVGLRELAQAGFNAQESIGLLRPVLDLAAGSLGELSPQAAAGLASQAMKAFGISVEGAGVAVDQMLQAVNVFALNASELPLALGTASRGAQALNQSLSETLIALGLVKNIIPGVERASTATAVAMERLADPQVQQRLRGIGVAVVDSQGGFRSFLDVLGDMAPALDRMTEAQRSAFLLQTFGREALGGVNAILTQVTNGIRTNTGETLRGAQAIAYLRRQFEEAGGTAGQFASKMLDTFAGQKQLLRGSLETLAIVLGEPFAQVLKPVVAAVVEALNLFLRFVRAVPAPVKKAFAGFIVAAGAVVALIGAVIAAKAGIALLANGFKALGISLGGIIATMLPAILIVAALAAVVAGFVVAFQKNLGGIGDFARRIGERVTLFFNGIKQLFEQGGFSGAVRDELNRAENQGLEQFLIRVYQIAYRIQQIWEGFKEGFTRTIEEARPVFQDLVAALSELGNEIAALFTGAADGAASLPSSEFRSFGQIAGSAIATVVTWLTKLIAIFARITGGIIAGFRSMMEYIGPAFETVGFALGELKAAWNTLTGATNDSSDAVNQSTSGWRTLGEVLGKIVGAAVTVVALALAGLIQVVTAVIWVVNVVKDAFIAAGTWIGETAGKIYLWFTETLPAAIDSAVETVVGFLELERQIRSGAILREAQATKKVSPAVIQTHPAAIEEFKTAYSVEFLGLAADHSEADLHGALLRNLGRFLTELGRDFCFVGSQYPVQVGNQDFPIDLVFFHRGLQCLVAFELKVDKFKPADIGQLSFYVEALDRDVKKPHERPSIGVLLCATKDDEVVEYALARTTSPTLVAEYQTLLPPKAVLRAKLHELYAQLAPATGIEQPGSLERVRVSMKKGARR